jgi:prepilin-type processing-associated H-X9-DG protein
MAIAMLNYNSEYGSFVPANTSYPVPNVPAAFRTNYNPVQLSWMFGLLPYTEQNGVFSEFLAAYNTPTATAASLTQLGVPIKIYYCPADPQGLLIYLNAPDDNLGYGGAIPIAMTDYAGIAGIDIFDNKGVLPTGSFTGVQIMQITDGASNTLMIGEHPFCGPPQATGTAFTAYKSWQNNNTSFDEVGMYPILPDGNRSDNTLGVKNTGKRVTANLQGAACSTSTTGYFFGQGPNNPLNFCSFSYLYSCHTAGANFALCDGSVRFVSYTISTTTLSNAATIAGGETLGSDW